MPEGCAQAISSTRVNDLASPESRLARQMAFLAEADSLKGVLRMTRILSGERRENDAEHSWHLALMALVLFEHAPTEIDLLKVMSMVVIHDLVEIDAGDTFAYDVAGMATQHEREARAAERIFGLLPPDQTAHLRGLWDEFEAQVTPEALFAGSIDRLAAIVPNSRLDGGTWREHDISVERVVARNAGIAKGAPTLWTHAQELIAEVEARGHIYRTPSAAERTSDEFSA